MREEDSPAARGPLVVMKFGGTSVGTPERMRRLVEIVEEAAPASRLVVVVSALSMVTRRLDAAFHRAAAGQPTAEAVEALRDRHRAQAAALLAPEELPRYTARLDEQLEALAGHLARIRTGGDTPARRDAVLRDAVLAAGEQLTVPMVAGALRRVGLRTETAATTRLMRTDDAHGAAHVDLAQTTAQVRTWHAALAPEVVAVVAGFIGSAPGGATTTLGFEGSDYSAALFASILGARELVRWTDVGGLYTADPRTHADARRLEQIDLAQAAALNEAGRLGMHPKALRPLLEASIPARIRCIDHPQQPGTRIVL